MYLIVELNFETEGAFYMKHKTPSYFNVNIKLFVFYLKTFCVYILQKNLVPFHRSYKTIIFKSVACPKFDKKKRAAK